MPFDGSGYLAAQTKPSLWGRVGAIIRLKPRARQPDTLLPLLVPEQAGNATLQVLLLGRALIEDRAHWVQRRYETRDGRRCAVGALRRAARLVRRDDHCNGAGALLLSVAQSRGFSDIENMNDHSTHIQVLSAFDEAIARAGG